MDQQRTQNMNYWELHELYMENDVVTAIKVRKINGQDISAE
jgi:hypothetical protein